MKKKIFQRIVTIFFVWICCLTLGLVYAAKSYVYDEAGLFSNAVNQELRRDAMDFSEELGIDLVIATINYRTEQSVQMVARDVLLDGGYGQGEGRGSIIFLIDMYRREYTVYEYNKYADYYILTDYEGDCILDAIEPDMKSGRYDQAAETFLDLCVYYARTDLGNNYETGTLHEVPKASNTLMFLAIGLIGGAAITVLLVISHKEKQVVSAGVYTPNRAMEVVNQADHFVRTTMVKRKIEGQKERGKRLGGGPRGNSGGPGGRRGPGGHSGGGRGGFGHSGGGHGGSRKF